VLEEAPGPRIGDRLGKYLLREKLGEGGMGMVFGGVHEALGREVAIKLLRAEWARNEQVMARFQREAEVVSRIGHPNIVTIYDFGRLADGTMYYVMERVHGETLRARLDRGPAPGDEELLALFGPMCRALRAAHAVGIVHRDLKPDNVLLQARSDGPPLVKVLDFGVAKMLETERSAALTNAGALIGTPVFMAPEQVAAAQRVDGRADLYSLGAMLYVCLAGRPPFVGEPMQVLIAHLRDPVPPLSSLPLLRATSPALEAMVLRALAKEPDGRPQDAAAFLAELEAALGRRERPSPATATVAPPRPRRVGWAIGLGVGLAAAVGGLVVVATHGRKSDGRASHGAAPGAVEREGASAGAAADPATIVAAALDGPAEERRTIFGTLVELGSAASPATATLIARGLDDDNPEVRRAAVQAAASAGRPGDRTLLDALAGAAARSSSGLAVDIAAARLHLGDAAGAPILVRALDGSDGVAQLRAALALAEARRIPPARLAAALAAAPANARHGLQRAAWAALGRLGDPAAAALFERALAGDAPRTRLDAALARGDDPRARAVLDELSAHASDADDRVAATAGVAALGDAGAFAAVAKETRDTSPATRARAARALAGLARVHDWRAAVVTALRPVVADPAPEPHLIAATALTALTAESPHP
jgi:HEAT repeat protein